MSKKCPPILNPLQRDGTSQRQRLLDALRPSYVRVDEREIDDWLLYARNYANLIRYYSARNEVDGDWVDFIQKDVSTLVALVANENTQRFAQAFAAHLEELECALTEKERALALARMVVTLHAMAETLHEWHTHAKPGLALHRALERRIAGKIGDGFAQVIAYIERGESLLPLEEAGMPEYHLPTLKQSWPQGLNADNLSIWPRGLPKPGRELERETRRLNELFKRFYEVMYSLEKDASHFMEETLENYPFHEPHMALFLAFLQLFKISRDDLNTLTERHLEFYYEEVLQLDRRDPVPDQVHLVLKLAQNFTQHPIAKDTLFEAGKDDTGVDLLYGADEEIVVNMAQLDEEHGLKTVFLGKDFAEKPNDEGELEKDLNDYIITNIHAAPKANTNDGIEEELPEDKPTWFTLGSEQMPQGEVGFAIASPMLLLGEGNREVMLNFRLNKLQATLDKFGKSRVKSELKNNVDIYLSGEEDWILIEQKSVEIDEDPNLSAAEEEESEGMGEIIFTLELDSEMDPVVPYNEEVLLQGLDTQYPVAKFVFNNDGLSTLGNLDLNLQGGIDEFDSNDTYLVQELAKLELYSRREQDLDYLIGIYRTQAEVRGASIRREVPVWQYMDLANAYPSTSDLPAQVESGMIVYSGGKHYLSLASFPSGDFDPGALEILSDQPQLIWKQDSFVEGEFDPEETYEEGDKVSIPDELDAETGRIYEVQAGQTADPIAPGIAVANWQLIPPFQNDNSYSSVEGDPYTYVTHDGSVYKFNGSDLPGTISDPIPAHLYPGANQALWVVYPTIEVDSGRYTRTRDASGEPGLGAVFFDNKIYELLFDDSIDDSQLEVYTESTPGLALVNRPWQNFNALQYTAGQAYSDGQDVYDGDSLYEVLIALPATTNPDQQVMLHPAEDRSPWLLIEEVPVATFPVADGDQPPSTSGPLVRETGTDDYAYRKADGSWHGFSVSAPVYTSADLDTTTQTDVHTTTFEFGQTFDDGSNHYMALVQIAWTSDGLAAAPSNPVTAAGGSATIPNSPFWAANSDLQGEYQTDEEYSTDQIAYIHISGNTYTYYRATAASKGMIPGQNVWDDIQDPVRADDEAGFNSFSFDKDEVVRKVNDPDPDVLYQATVANFTFNTASSYYVWEFDGSADNYNYRQEYAINDLVIYPEGSSQYYQAINPIEGDAAGPNLNTVDWQFETEFANYDADREYQAGTFVGAGESFYIARVGVIGIHPELELPIWEEINELADAYEEDTLYPVGTYVLLPAEMEEGGDIFRANGGVTGIEPSRFSSLDFWKRLPYYESGKVYNQSDNDIVRYNRGAYEAIDENVDVAPNSSAAAGKWNPLSIEVYDPNQEYLVGTVVSECDQFYIAIASEINEVKNKGIVPGSTPTLWDEQALVREYDTVQTFKLGDYVDYEDGLTYRVMVDEITGGDFAPDKAPHLWQPVGEIRAYNNNKQVSQGIHVKAPDGTIYKSLADIAKNPNWDGSFPADQWEKIFYSYPYRFFRDPQLERLQLKVVVTDVENILLENDDGVIAPGKPFNPFTTTPTENSRFYIGSNEVFKKSLSKLNIHLEYGDLPKGENGQGISFIDHYTHYREELYSLINADGTAPTEAQINAGRADMTLANLEVEAYLLLNGDWQNGEILDPDIDDLFVGQNTAPEVPAENRSFEFTIKPIQFPRSPDLEAFEALRPGMSRGFLRLELKRDFLHEEFTSFLTKAALEQRSDLIPNQPYTPLINSISLDYEATEIITFKDKEKSDFENRVERFYHLYPFGQAEFIPVAQDDGQGTLTSLQLVPKFEGQKVIDEATGELGTFDANGTLYLGLKDLKPPQNLHILFQMAEGSEDPEPDPQRVSWAYLSQNRWIPFTDQQLLADDTNGLLRSGIVKFAMPAEMTDDNSILPGGLHWIKASVVDYAAGVALALSVHPQAVKASFRDQGNDPDHLLTPLPAETISNLRIRQAGIDSVVQPYESFGGRVAERDNEFYTRVSERLRHKQRGVGIWDYERLVLEQFPDVYKCKCLNHTGNSSEFQPGKVRLVVVPDLRNKFIHDPTQPTMSKDDKLTIRDWLKTKVSDFADVEVLDPRYEQVQAKLEVWFQPGLDQGFYTKQLHHDITRFLSPWRFDEGADLLFGGEVKGSLLLNYIDELPYVDYIANFQLVELGDPDEGDQPCPVDNATAKTSRSVLISATEHEITPKIKDPCKT